MSRGGDSGKREQESKKSLKAISIEVWENIRSVTRRIRRHRRSKRARQNEKVQGGVGGKRDGKKQEKEVKGDTRLLGKGAKKEIVQIAAHQAGSESQERGGRGER